MILSIFIEHVFMGHIHTEIIVCFSFYAMVTMLGYWKEVSIEAALKSWVSICLVNLNPPNCLLLSFSAGPCCHSCQVHCLLWFLAFPGKWLPWFSHEFLLVISSAEPLMAFVSEGVVTSCTIAFLKTLSPLWSCLTWFYSLVYLHSFFLHGDRDLVCLIW